MKNTGDRKQEILNVTTDLLQTRVFSAFSYQDIADRLGVTKAAIHSHYRTKEMLGNAIIEQYQMKADALYDKAERAGDSAWDKFDAFVNELAYLITECNEGCPITLLQVEHNVIPQSMQKGISRIYDTEKAWVSRILKQGRDEGVMFFRGSPDEQASLVLAAAHGAYMHARAAGPEMFKKIMGQLKINMN